MLVPRRNNSSLGMVLVLFPVSRHPLLLYADMGSGIGLRPLWVAVHLLSCLDRPRLSLGLRRSFQLRILISFKFLMWEYWLLQPSYENYIQAYPLTANDTNYDGNVTMNKTTLATNWLYGDHFINVTGIINTILSWKAWLPCSRISYVGYLTHGIVLFVFMKSRPVQYYITDWGMVSQ